MRSHKKEPPQKRAAGAISSLQTLHSSFEEILTTWNKYFINKVDIRWHTFCGWNGVTNYHQWYTDDEGNDEEPNEDMENVENGSEDAADIVVEFDFVHCETSHIIILPSISAMTLQNTNQVILHYNVT